MLVPLMEHFILDASLMRPNSPSQAELSGGHPFLDMDRSKPALSIRPIQPGHRWWHPLSPWTTGCSFSFNCATALSSMLLANAASGEAPIVQLGSIPSKQSTIGDRWILPAGMANSAISVGHLQLGFPARKSLCVTFGTDGEISPLWELYFSLAVLLTIGPSSFMSFRTIFSEMMEPSFFNRPCILLYP